MSQVPQQQVFWLCWQTPVAQETPLVIFCVEACHFGVCSRRWIRCVGKKQQIRQVKCGRIRLKEATTNQWHSTAVSLTKGLAAAAARSVMAMKSFMCVC